MRIDKVEYKVYKFGELSAEAKEKAIDKYYENENYPFLEDDLKEELFQALDAAGFEYRREGVKLYYSLSNSQGDGLCFTGNFWSKSNPDLNINITHSGHYYHERSASFEFTNEAGGMIDDNDAFIDQYRDICRGIAKYGYSIIEYRMNNEEMAEHCDANEYEFHASGDLY